MLFGYFKRRPPLPKELPEALIEAVYRKDAKALAELCDRHQEEIRRSFSAWSKVPEPLRQNEAALARYCNGLIAVASFFESSGDPSLMQRLQGDEADNPLILWERDLEEAQALTDSGRPDEAIARLHATLERSRGLTGNGVTANLPRTYGCLGVACFRAGDKPKAIEYTQQALELCRMAGDLEGVRIYTANVDHIRSHSS